MQQQRDIFLLFLVPVIWGANFVMIKFLVNHAPPLVVMSVRYAITAIALSPWLKNLKHLKEYKDAAFAVIGFAFIYFALFFTGARLIPAAESIILTQLQVPISTIAAVIILKEQLSARTVIGILIAFVGMVITVGMPDRTGQWEGVILIVLSGFVWGAANISMKRIQSIDVMTFNAMMATFALPPMIISSAILEPHGFAHFFAHVTLMEVGALCYMVFVSTCLAYGIWITMLRRHAVNLVAPFNLLVPVFGILGATVILHEPLLLHTVIGAAICLLGLAMIVFNGVTLGRR